MARSGAGQPAAGRGGSACARRHLGAHCRPAGRQRQAERGHQIVRQRSPAHLLDERLGQGGRRRGREEVGDPDGERLGAAHGGDEHDAGQGVHRDARLGQGAAAVEIAGDVEQVLLIPAVPVELEQPAQRRQVVRVEIDRLEVGVGRQVGVAESAPEPVEGSALPGAGGGDELAQDAGAGRVVAGLAVEAKQAGQRGDRARLVGQHLLVEGDGGRAVAAPLAQLGQLQAGGADRAHVVERDEIEQRARGGDGARQIADAQGGARNRGERLAVARVEADRLAETGAGLLIAAEHLGDLAAPTVEDVGGRACARVEPVVSSRARPVAAQVGDLGQPRARRVGGAADSACS